MRSACSGLSTDYNEKVAGKPSRWGSSQRIDGPILTQVCRVVLILLALVGLAALAVVFRLVGGGIQSTDTPGAVETTVARRLRSFGIPAAAKRDTNPVAATQEVLDEG